MLQAKPDKLLINPIKSPSEISKSGYGMSHFDGTEHVFGVSSEMSSTMENIIPSRFSYRDSMPEIINQGDNPWCVAYSLSAMINCLLNIKKRTDNIDYGIDEKVIYDLRKDKHIDGMYPKTALSEARNKGIYIESLGEKLKIKGYAWVGAIESMKAALLLNGPLLVGILVRDYNKPEFWRGYNYHGGHAIVVTGYDDESQTLEIRNSWGPSYGDGGYYHISYKDAVNEFLECWTIYL